MVIYVSLYSFNLNADLQLQLNSKIIFKNIKKKNKNKFSKIMILQTVYNLIPWNLLMRVR